MRCEVVQRRLMSIEDATKVPPDLRVHLAACAQCRDWQGQLVQFERHIPLLPVPKSRGKSRLLRKLMHDPVAGLQSAAVAAAGQGQGGRPLYAPWPSQQRPRKRGKVRFVAALVAAVAVILFGWWLLGPSRSTRPEGPAGKPTTDPLLASLVHYDLRLNAASTPGERLDILADVAQALHDESRTLAGEAAQDELSQLAGLYERVVRNGLTKCASTLSPAQRVRSLKPIIDQLEKAAQASERLSKRTPAECARPVQKMAAIAWEGRRQLTSLLSEAKG
jgi:hypothetical protein